MIATANEAVEALRHRRTGEVLATKKIARNTRLVYFADELVGLKLHDTIIAMYKPDGVTIDVRGSGAPNDQGWFTNVTLQRLQDWTPARIERANGLTFLRVPTAGDPLALYAHGTHVRPDGSCEIPIEPVIQRAIVHVVRSYPAKLRRHADQILDAWSRWNVPSACCLSAEDEMAHYLTAHFERGDVCVPPVFHTLMTYERDTTGLYGEKLLERGRTWLRDELKQFTALAVKQLAPEFPYPQLTRTSS